MFKFLYKKENKVKGMKGGTLTIHRAIAAFYMALIIPVVRRSFIRARFRLNPDNLFAPLTMNPEIVFERIAISEIPIEQFVTPEAVSTEVAKDGEIRRRHWILGPHEFVASLQAHINKAGGTCLFLVTSRRKTFLMRKKR
jgi:hypothetical protein